MASRPSSGIRLSDPDPAPDASTNRPGAKLKAFLTAVMGLLSILVFGLACLRRSVLWLWIGFFCALISGIFVQLLINREKKRLAIDRSGK